MTPDREINPPDPIECATCDGLGHFEGSDCCGAAPRSNGDCDTSDFGICPDCYDHCEYDTPCPECDGAGTVAF